MDPDLPDLTALILDSNMQDLPQAIKEELHLPFHSPAISMSDIRGSPVISLPELEKACTKQTYKLEKTLVLQSKHETQAEGDRITMRTCKPHVTFAANSAELVIGGSDPITTSLSSSLHQKLSLSSTPSTTQPAPPSYSSNTPSSYSAYSAHLHALNSVNQNFSQMGFNTFLITSLLRNKTASPLWRFLQAGLLSLAMVQITLLSFRGPKALLFNLDVLRVHLSAIVTYEIPTEGKLLTSHFRTSWC